MKTRTGLLLLGILINGATSMIHTLRYFDTSSSQIPNFPEFVSVGLVNDLPIVYCDSETKTFVPKQEWMNRVTEDDPQYWEQQTQMCLNNVQWNKDSIEIAKQRFNQTEGAHIVQRMIGCDWDDENDQILGGYVQYAFDGEDFIALDYKTDTFVAAKSQAVVTKHKWERAGDAVIYKDYINNRCAEYLKRYVRYGASTLKKTESPLVSLLQKSSSAPVTCHATGFYPDRAFMFWTKDGDELHEGVDPGEILPNHDGTFQTSVDLDVSSVPPEDWHRYECVFQLSGVKEDLLTRLDPDKIRTNEKKYKMTIIAALLGVHVVVVLAAVGVVLFRRFRAKQLSPAPSGVKHQLVQQHDEALYLKAH